MIFLVAMTREQFVQQRKSTAEVYARKVIAPAVLFVTSFVVMIWMKHNKMQLSNLNELALHCLVLGTSVLSLVWATVIGLRNDKLNAIHCSSCRKNISSTKASPWLTASGTCFYCNSKIFQDVPATMNSKDGKPLHSRAEYESKLKLTEAKLSKAALLVGAPWAIFLFWWAFLNTDPAKMSSEPMEPKDMAILLGPMVISAFLLLYSTSRIENQSGARCTNCGAFPSPHRKKIVLATGGCVRCGHRMFRDQPLHSDSQMPVSA